MASFSISPDSTSNRSARDVAYSAALLATSGIGKNVDDFIEIYKRVYSEIRAHEDSVDKELTQKLR